MGRFDRNTQVPRNSGGSYVPPDTVEGVQTKKFVMKEKTSEMLKYAMPLVNSFPRRDRKLADTLRDSMMEMFRLVTRLEWNRRKREILEELDVELAVLREFVVLASDRDYCGEKFAPPLTMHQREVWSRYTTEIGKMIGGYKKYIDMNEPAK